MDDYKVVPSGVPSSVLKYRQHVIEAYQAGKQIQIRRRTPPGEKWQDWEDYNEPLWQWDTTEYRVKPTKEDIEKAMDAPLIAVLKRKTSARIKIMQAFVDGQTIQYRRRHSDKPWADATTPTWGWDDYEYRIKVSLPVPQELIDQVGEALSAIHMCSMEALYPDHVVINPKPDFLYDHVGVEELLINNAVRAMLPEDASASEHEAVRQAVWEAMITITKRAWGSPISES